MDEQSALDEENAVFWSQLCGTNMAKTLGITDSSKESLKKFDDWFFGFYEYLPKYIPFNEVKGLKVLEIGLGYGSVSQRLMESGADFHALDISSAPVSFSKHRASLVGAQSTALDIPYPDNYFDLVVSIGCLHHTGNLPLALKETVRVLKPGGKISGMLYSSVSYRQLFKNPYGWLKEKFGVAKDDSRNANSNERSVYDANSKGEAAPYVTFTSSKQLRKFLLGLKEIEICSENLGIAPPLSSFLLKTAWRFSKVTGKVDEDRLLFNSRKILLPIVRLLTVGTDYYFTGIKR